MHKIKTLNNMCTCTLLIELDELNMTKRLKNYVKNKKIK